MKKWPYQVWASATRAYQRLVLLLLWPEFVGGVDGDATDDARLEAMPILSTTDSEPLLSIQRPPDEQPRSGGEVGVSQPAVVPVRLQ